MVKILRYDDILKITEFLKENGYSDYGITISTKVPDVETLNKVNEDFFYRLKNEDSTATPEYGDVVNVTVNGITYCYTALEKEEEG